MGSKLKGRMFNVLSKSHHTSQLCAKKLSSCLVYALFLLPVTTAFSAEEVRAEATRPIEEIIVLEQQSVQSLHFQMEILEDKIYDTLNDLIDDEDFYVICTYPEKTHTYIRTRTCEPAYLRKLKSEAWDETTIGFTEDRWENFDLTNSSTNMLLRKGGAKDIEAQEKNAEYRRLVDEIAQENPQLSKDILDKYYIYQELEFRKEN